MNSMNCALWAIHLKSLQGLSIHPCWEELMSRRETPVFPEWESSWKRGQDKKKSQLGGGNCHLSETWFSLQATAVTGQVYVASEWDTLDIDIEPVWPTPADPPVLCLSTMTLHWDPRDVVLVKCHWCLPQGSLWACYIQVFTLHFFLSLGVFILVCAHFQVDVHECVWVYMWMLKAGTRWLSVLF